jgi:hypothetical protein
MLYWDVDAFNADSSRYVSLLAIADEPSGTYSLNDLYAGYTFVGVFTAPNDTAWYSVIDANITVAVNGENATINGTLLGQNEDDEEDVIEFTLILNLAVVDRTDAGEQYDAEDKDFAVDFASYKVEDKYLAQYGVLFIEAQNENKELVVIELWVPNGAGALVAGEYPVDAKEMVAGTVTACSVSQYINGSYAGSLDKDDYVNVPFWYFAEGKVTVNEDLSIDVDAINTWGRTIKSHLATGEQAIDNTDAVVKAVKLVRDGQLIIIKNGVEFNAQGAIVR